MQLRMSPGGRMRFSRRKRPELPPSSVTVTIAVRSAMGCRRRAESSRRRVTYSLSPRSSVERPVPPPRATILKPRDVFFELGLRFIMGAENLAHSIKGPDERVRQPIETQNESYSRRNCYRGDSARRAVFLGIEQFSEARVFLKESEILIVSSVIAIFGAKFNRDL